MFAIIETNGKQYPVEEGKLIAFPSWIGRKGEEITFEQVLLFRDQNRVLVGKPYLEDARVRGRVVQLQKGKKILVFKYKPKVNYRRKIGYRQEVALVKIERIEVKE